MKFLYILPFLSILFTGQLIAQAPQSFQYQAVIRDGSGNPLLNTPVQFRFSIEKSDGSSVYYQENQAVVSNALGGINLVIGKGSVTAGNFENINWKSGEIRVRVEMDPLGGQNFLPFGITTLQSVPFAIYSDQATTLNWNGNDWDPGDDKDEQTLTVNGNQLAISNGNAVTLPTGSGGGDNWGTQTVETDPEISGNGTLSSPLSIASQGAENGEVLKWNGNSWTPGNDNSQDLTAGDGITIIADAIINTGDDDNDPDNEIQTLSINGNTLSLTNGGMVTLPSAPTYIEGTGINITGNTIAAENTEALWNANQLRGINVLSTPPDAGDYLQYVLGSWRPASGPATYWVPTGNNIYYNAGNVGLGVTNPASRLHIFNEDKIQMDEQTFGKWASISIEFSSNIVPAVDDNRSLGTTARRWTQVWATDGTINTSDARDKENIQSLNYGLDDVMKLRPVSFSWKDRPESGIKLGLIAQELETVIPEVVANPGRTPSINSEPGAEGEIKLGVYYSDLIPVLIKAIQEQEEKIRQLQEEIALLKKQN